MEMGQVAEVITEERPEYKALHITGDEYGVFNPDMQLTQTGSKMECQITASRLNYAVTIGINHGLEMVRTHA